MIKKYILPAVLFFLLILTGYFFLFKKEEPVWFEDLKGEAEFSSSIQENLLRYSWAYFHQEELPSVSPDLKQNSSPSIVFLSVSDGNGPAEVVYGKGTGLFKAFQKALNKVDADYKPLWIKMDIVKDTRMIELKSQYITLDMEPQGIALDENMGRPILPEELYIMDLSLNEKVMDLSRAVNMISGESNREKIDFKGKTLYSFRTLSSFFNGKEFFILYRGHRDFSYFTEEELLESAEMAGSYLSSSILPGGRFIYSYTNGNIAKKYNILRHCGTVYSMLELYEVTDNEELLKSLEEPLDYIVESIKPWPGEDGVSAIVEDGSVKLGGNGLAIIALSKYTELTGDRKYLPYMIELSRWIKLAQNDSGEFFIHKAFYPSGKVDNFKSGYYPGEAILGLLRLYRLTSDESLLDTAEKNALYLINIRDKDVPPEKLNHDHWLLYALNELYRERKKDIYLKHAFLISSVIIEAQNRTPEYPDWLGSFYKPPRSTPTATRIEGLYAACQLARDFGTDEDVSKILEAMKLGISFQLQTQVRPENAIYLKDPHFSTGGFRRSLTSFEIRIDYVQHNISSILGMWKMMGSEE